MEQANVVRAIVSSTCPNDGYKAIEMASHATNFSPYLCKKPIEVSFSSSIANCYDERSHYA